MLRCDPPVIDALVARAEIQLEQAHTSALATASQEQLAGAALGWLRLGREDRAIQTIVGMLRRCDSQPQDPDADARALVASHWGTRVLGDAVTQAAAAPIARAAARLVENGLTQEPRPSLRDAAWRAHGLACAADLARRISAPAFVETLNVAAQCAMLDFEASFWSDSLDAFSARPGGLDADALIPCSIGMLASTEGRAERSLRATLLPNSLARPDELNGLVARAQLGMPLAEDLATMLAASELAFDDPGRRLDAAIFALTGLRLATGPDLDATWMRLRPCLPRGVTQMRIEGLALDGWTCSLEVAAAGNEDPADLRGVYRLVARTPPTLRWRQLVVHQGDHTFVAAAIDGNSIELPPREAPVTSLDARAR